MEFCKSHFSRSERLIYYVLKYDDFKLSSQLNPTQKTDIFAFKLRPTFTRLLGKRRAISHRIAVPNKTMGNVNRPPYRSIAVNH